MLKKLLGLTIFFIAYDALAAQVLDLYQAPLSSLKHFPIAAKAQNSLRRMSRVTTETNTLQEVSQTQEQAKTIVRYQQKYRGLAVAGAQVIISKEANNTAQVNGHLLEEIQLNTRPTVSTQQAIDLAKNSWFHFNPQSKIDEELIELQIRPGKNEELKLVYLVSLQGRETNNKPVLPIFVIDAHSGELYQQWNNLKNYMDGGPGGNDKTQQYWYGKDNAPALDVSAYGEQCTMDTPKVKLINLKYVWDWFDNIIVAHQYPCNLNNGDRINGAFSPSNDAYYFGHTIVNMYKEWYGVNALQLPNGAPMQLVMRVHFGKFYDNAFWNGSSMSFGDGEDLYPLVSLDIAGHEVTHGFTDQHSNLEYHDQSGALNESVSDMAGQAARAYLLEKYPDFYRKMYMDATEVTWGIGETVMKDPSSKAIRFLDTPSADGSSADCLDKDLAQSHGVYCAISYADVVAYANTQITSPQSQQGYIVHSGSGVFNKAFYLLAKNIGIKTAYHVMVIANSKYWTPATDFYQGACGVLYAARDLAVDLHAVKPVFGQVGVDISSCSI